MKNVLVFASLLALWHLVPAGQLAPAGVGPEQDSYVIAPGSEAAIVVRLNNANEAYGIDVWASFDPSLLEVVDADPITGGIQVEVGSFPQPDFVAANRVDPAGGAIRYVITQMNPTSPATGSGILFTVRLRGRGVSGAGEFRIDQVEMSDRDGQLQPVSVSSATIEVVGNDLTGPEAQPTGVALAPTTSEAAQVTVASIPTQEVMAAATPAVSQSATATRPAAPSHPIVPSETPMIQSHVQESATDPAGPLTSAMGENVQPTEVTGTENVAAPESSSERMEVIASSDNERAPLDASATPAESNRTQAFAEAAAESAAPADMSVIGEGKTVTEVTVVQPPPNSQDGEGLQWPYWLALAIVIAIASAAAFAYRRAS